MPRLSLRAKLLASFILILLPVLGLLVYGYREANERLIQYTLDNQMQTAQAVAALVDANFDEALTLGWTLANDPLVRTFDKSRLDPYLERLAPVYPQYEQFGVINADGEGVGVSKPSLPGTPTSARDRPHFRQVMATGKPVISQVIVSLGTRRPTIAMLVPIKDEAGDTIGAVYAASYLAALPDRLRGVALGPEQHILLADTTGTAAFHTALPDLVWEQRDLHDFEPVRAALEGRSTELSRYTSPLLNDTRIGAFTPSPKYAWVVGVSVREDVVLGTFQSTIRGLLLGFGAIAIFCVGLAFVLSRRLVEPIRRLANHALALGQGDLKRRVVIKTGDELERLGDTFNEMAKSLGRTMQERQALGQVAGALVRELELEGVANVVIEQGQRVLGSHTVALFLADLAREELRLLATRELGEKSVADFRVIPFNAPYISAVAARRGQPVEVPDVKALDHELAGARRVAEREGQRSLFAQPLFAKGRLVGVLTFAKPTPYHFEQRERELVQAVADLCAAAVENARLYDELRQTLDLREEFITAAAHELKTPVTTIKGYVQAMRKWSHGGHEPREGVALDAVNRQCDRISRRVHEMIESVRLRRAAEDYRVRFRLDDLAAEVVDRMQAATELHRLVLKRDATSPVDADRERIEEVLVSLVDNAIKFSPVGGDIEVRIFAKGREAVVAVKDQGVGVSLERQAHIFEPFYEAVPSGAPGYRGVAALSLYLSRLTVERHHGRIWFESAEGEGSTFYFSVPLAQAS